MATDINIWNHMYNWELVLPPSRPSLPQLNFFHRHLVKIDKNEPIAVLGSTPEYRDMLAFMGFVDIYIFDKSQLFYDLTSNLRSRNNSETVVVGDWLTTLVNYPKVFGAILSDLTSGNIHYDMHEKFYHLISSALRRNGIFCDKILTQNKDLLTLSYVYNKYKLAPLNLLTANHLNCEGLFCSEVLRDSHCLNTSIAYRKLEQLSSEKGWRKILDCTKKITPLGGIWYYGKPWNQIKKNYFKHIKIIESDEDFPGSPYEGRVKLFIGTGLP